MRRLFEGGVTNAETLAAGGDYSRAATIRGRRLIDEIRYIGACPYIIFLQFADATKVLRLADY